MPRGHVLLGGREQREAAIEPAEHGRGREQSDARRRQLDREREAVEPRTDLLDRLGVLAVRLESRSGGARPLDEELGRRGRLERRHRVLALRANPERRAARHEHLQTRRGRDELGDLRRRRQHVLEVVEHEQGALVAELAGEALRVGVGRAELLGKRSEHETGIGERLQLDEHGSAREVACRRGGSSERQPRLTGAARPRERDEADLGVGEQCLHRLELGVPADERDLGLRQLRTVQPPRLGADVPTRLLQRHDLADERDARGSGELPARAVALGRVLRERGGDHLVDRRRQVADELGHPRRRVAEMTEEDRDVRVLPIRAAPGEALEEHAAERVDVDRRRDLAALDLLGRRVVDAADEHPRLRLAAAAGELGDAEVRQERAARGGILEEDVGRLDVAVHHARGRGPRRARPRPARSARASARRRRLPSRPISRARSPPATSRIAM